MIATGHLLSDYLEAAMEASSVEQLEDGTFLGRVQGWVGLLSFGTSASEAEDNLRATLEEWVVQSLRDGSDLPVFAGIDLNRRALLEPLDTL